MPVKRPLDELPSPDPGTEEPNRKARIGSSSREMRGGELATIERSDRKTWEPSQLPRTRRAVSLRPSGDGTAMTSTS